MRSYPARECFRRDARAPHFYSIPLDNSGVMIMHVNSMVFAAAVTTDAAEFCLQSSTFPAQPFQNRWDEVLEKISHRFVRGPGHHDQFAARRGFLVQFSHVGFGRDSVLRSDRKERCH